MPEDSAGAWTDIVVGNEVYGRVLRTHAGVKPVFVSVGNKVDLATAARMTILLTREGKSYSTADKAGGFDDTRGEKKA